MNPIYNDDGKVILRFYQPTPKLVEVAGQEVYFDARFGISLAFVDESLVAPLLGYLGGCCGQKRQIIFLATETQYKHWQDGNGGR